MKILIYIAFTLACISFNEAYAQRTEGDEKASAEARKKGDLEAFEKPVREFVGWMTTNLQLSATQEKQLLDFYLSTPIYFPSIGSPETDALKEESMAKQEATLKRVLTPEKLETLISRQNEAQQVLLRNLPK